jgi:hypothetical protein
MFDGILKVFPCLYPLRSLYKRTSFRSKQDIILARRGGHLLKSVVEQKISGRQTWLGTSPSNSSMISRRKYSSPEDVPATFDDTRGYPLVI